jgi:hypothetical protein
MTHPEKSDLLSTMTEENMNESREIEIVDPDGMRIDAGFVIGRYKGKSIKMNFIIVVN